MIDQVDDTDTFCIYCQHDFKSHRKLVNHIKDMHYGTIAWWHYVKGQSK